MSLAFNCEHTDRRLKAHGLCQACYLKSRGYSHRFYVKHRGEMIHRASEWNRSHPDQRKATARVSSARKYRTIEGQLVSTIRARINGSLSGKIKRGHVPELLGCSIEFLREWLASQFQPGMSWSNHGKRGWPIDHVKPCATFDLSDPKQQHECFHYSNLQPLWWRDNLSKGARI